MTMKNIEEIFAERTCYHYDDREVSSFLIQEIYDLMKLGPTSANCCPLRIVFLQSKSEKEKLLSCLMEGNIPHTRSAPVTAIFAYDTKFYDKMDKLWAHNPGMQEMLKNNQALASGYMMRNSSLQAAYFMIVARSLGLACGPMSGFYEEAINKTFLANTDHRVNFICNLGYRSKEEERPRPPRLEFDEVCRIL